MTWCKTCRPAKVQAYFGPPGQPCSMRCSNCRIEGDINIHHACRSCRNVRASFGPVGTKKRIWCKDCKEPGTVSNSGYLCKICGTKRALYGEVGNAGRLRCGKCRLETDVDKEKTICKICSQRTASYGAVGTKSRVRCRSCKLSDDVYLRAICKTCRANKQPIFGREGEKIGQRCVECKHPDDVVLTHRYCKSKHHPVGQTFRIVVTSETDYLCYVCRHVGKWRNRQEREVVSSLTVQIPNHNPTLLDKIIGGNLSLRYRPDIYYDLGNRALIVEIDETQHERYPASCEAKRMLEIAMTLGVPTVFLRYNPDRFEDESGTVRKVRKERRLQVLADRVRSWITKIEWPRFFKAEYLWYSARREEECCRETKAALGCVFVMHPELKE